MAASAQNVAASAQNVAASAQNVAASAKIVAVSVPNVAQSDIYVSLFPSLRKVRLFRENFSFSDKDFGFNRYR